MADRIYDVVGIGNAIVDIIARCDDAFLSRHDLAKGFMRLIPASEAGRLYEAMGPAIERSGGSAANTVAGLASLGASCGFIGRVAADQFGGIFRHDIRSLGRRENHGFHFLGRRKKALIRTDDLEKLATWNETGAILRER